MAQDPSLLQGDFGAKDQMGRILSRSDLLAAYREHRDLTEGLMDLASGIVTLSVFDYDRMPGVTIAAWHMYRHVLMEGSAARSPGFLRDMMKG